MKKRVLAILVIALVTITGIAKAGNSTEVTSVPKVKNEGGNKTVKSQSKYTFTLFSFFTTENKTTKTDTSGTLLKNPIRKEEKD